ncbi:HAD-IB family hydrolase [Nocardia carnea]|uniref:HAD-IB family hydrolase n=1 Tax=Nocardia carnea TaxID=37328 RepID=UPI002456BC80|nr:HAD-IB family hydrolase [Nocardia carnea]
MSTVGNSIESVVQAIRTGPGGPRIAAFFDFDGTIVDGVAALRFGRPGRSGDDATVLLPGLAGWKNDIHRELIGRLVSEIWRGRPVADLEAAEDRLCHHHLARNLRHEAWGLIREHLRAGHTVVLATAATRFQTRLMARELGIEHVLCTEPVVSGGVLTGEVEGEIVWGRHKAELVAEFAIAHDLDLENSFGYSNGGADRPLLELVGHPIAVNPDRELAAAATAGGWTTLRFERRGRNLYHLGRTLLGLLAVIGAAGAAMVCSPGRDRRALRRRILRWVPAAALRCAGLRIRVTGAETVRTTRPAVFLFNHQSKIDTLIVPYVVGDSFTPVATRKAQKYPIFGPLLKVVGSLFIDRSTPGGAQQALNSLVGELRAGNSVAIAPEGRVSSTPRLQTFKKGAFHLAAQAGVPIVPIVIHNAGRALWRNSLVVRPGTIDVTVLDPIDTASWTPATLDDEVAAVHRRYLDTLDRRPGIELPDAPGGARGSLAPLP